MAYIKKENGNIIAFERNAPPQVWDEQQQKNVNIEGYEFIEENPETQGYDQNKIDEMNAFLNSGGI